MNYGKRAALFRPSSRSIESESVLSFDEFEDDDKDNVKRKTRNLSEKKRRDQFNVLINELCSMVSANTKKLDKSSVLKSAIQFLRNHQEFSVQSAANEIKEDWKPTFLCNEEFAQLMLEAVDSFLVVFNHHGKVLFTSDSVTSLLGHLPTDLINNSLDDLMHEDDKLKFFNILAKHVAGGESFISFTCHLRRGTINLTDPVTYECVRVMGTSQVVHVDADDCQPENGSYGGTDPVPGQALCFCCTVRLQTSHIIREMANVEEATSEFTSRHSLEWKFLFLDLRAPPIIGYLPFEVLGTSGYDYYHPDDLEVVSQCHEQLMVMGKGTSSFYRFLTKGQQWIWLQTHYYITYHQWNSKPEFIVCTNKVVSYQEVRRQLRQDMGYTEEDAITTVANSTTNNNNSNSSNSSQGTLAPVLGDGRVVGGPGRTGGLQQEGHVTSYSHSDSGAGRVKAQKVQSPDVASSHYSDSERPQLPHSTKQENGGGNSSDSSSHGQKRVSSHLQSLLQVHLQRHQAAAAAAGGGGAGRVNVSAAAASSSATNSVSQALSTTQASVSSTHTKVTSSFESGVTSPTQQQQQQQQQQQVSISQTRTMPSLMSHMTAVTSTAAPGSSNQRYPTGLILNPAQQFLCDQLRQKSKQLENAIESQKAELRLIQEQLAFSTGAAVSLSSHMQMHQPQKARIHQQPQQQHPHQPHQAQLQGQHQYILQQRFDMGSHPMLVTQQGGSAPQLAVMEGAPNQIFLSPLSPVGLNMQPQQQQQGQRQQQQQQQQHHQVVLQHDAAGTSPQSMLLTSNPSHTPQLTMMGGRPGQIYISPINVDQLHQQPPQQAQHHQHYQPQHHLQQQQQQQQDQQQQQQHQQQ
ncbi:hypothetical protein EGW08_002720 [Elysia chlorotica]|uniref:Clock n=1 Tax=Elysia chlorotica TaxID=188477 RepID=A0A433U6S1_ELYCH|nr:hypothetical protein EGW08_002720 [Elysia chlorotica]